MEPEIHSNEDVLKHNAAPVFFPMYDSSKSMYFTNNFELFDKVISLHCYLEVLWRKIMFHLQLEGIPDDSPQTYGFTREMCAKISNRDGVGLFYTLDWKFFTENCKGFHYGAGKGQDAGEVQMHKLLLMQHEFVWIIPLWMAL